MVVCSGRVYEYKGVIFEYTKWAYGWWPLKKDGDPYKIMPKKVRPIWSEWISLSVEERKKYVKGGGCERL